MTKYYFYKATIEPTDGHAYYDHSNGIAGYHTPQARRGFITFGTLGYLDEIMAQRVPKNGMRHTNVLGG